VNPRERLIRNIIEAKTQIKRDFDAALKDQRALLLGNRIPDTASKVDANTYPGRIFEQKQNCAVEAEKQKQMAREALKNLATANRRIRLLEKRLQEKKLWDGVKKDEGYASKEMHACRNLRSFNSSAQEKSAMFLAGLRHIGDIFAEACSRVSVLLHSTNTQGPFPINLCKSFGAYTRR
jgi:hypothetical protein